MDSIHFCLEGFHEAKIAFQDSTEMPVTLIMVNGILYHAWIPTGRAGPEDRRSRSQFRTKRTRLISLKQQ